MWTTSHAASDTHLFLALEWLERAGKRYGNGHETTKQASQACLAAHLMRYGRVPNELLVEVIKARSQVRKQLCIRLLVSESGILLCAVGLCNCSLRHGHWCFEYD